MEGLKSWIPDNRGSSSSRVFGSERDPRSWGKRRRRSTRASTIVWGPERRARRCPVIAESAQPLSVSLLAGTGV